MTKTLAQAARAHFEFRILVIRACFGFRASDFEFPRLRPYKKGMVYGHPFKP